MTVVTNSLTITDSTPKAKGFGTALIAGYHTKYNDVRKYTADNDGLLGLVGDGFSVDDEIYQMASAFVAQSPHASEFKVGRLRSAVAESFTLTINEAVAGETYAVRIRCGAGAAETASYVAQTGDDTTEIATALELLIEALTGVASTSALAVITCTPVDAAKPIKIRGYTRNISFAAVGAATDYAPDLANIASRDNDWYLLLCAGTSALQIAACQSWAESAGKNYFYLTADTDCHTAGTADLLSVAHASNLHRSFGFPTRDQGGRLDCAVAGFLLSYAPPSIVAIHGKSVSGPIIDDWSPTERSVIKAKFGNAYYNELGIPMLHDGWAASGRYFDVTLLADWMVARIDESLVQAVATNATIPFNIIGEGVVQSAISGPLAMAESAGVIAPAGDPNGGWLVVVPPSANVSQTNRTRRRYPGSTYSFRALGSMQDLDVKGTMGF
jgi:hypothetical protein